MRVLVSKISPTFPRSVNVQWDVEPDAGVSGDYIFHVERAGSPGGPWTDISGPLLDTISYKDDLTDSSLNTEDVNISALNRELYYRVRAIDPVSTEDYSEPVNLEGVSSVTISTGITGMGLTVSDSEQQQINPNIAISVRPKTDRRKRLLRRKLLRDQYIALRHFNGVDARIAKRRHFGTRCPTCADTLTSQSLIYNCTTCYGTGWTGGFFTPLSTFVKISPAATREDVTELGNTSQRSTTLQTISYPKLEPGDLVIEVDMNRRWLVTHVAPTEVHRIVTKQTASINELARGSIEYCLPLA